MSAPSLPPSAPPSRKAIPFRSYRALLALGSTSLRPQASPTVTQEPVSSMTILVRALPTPHEQLIEVMMVSKAQFHGGLTWRRSMTERSSCSDTLWMERSMSVVGKQAYHKESGIRVDKLWFPLPQNYSHQNAS